MVSQSLSPIKISYDKQFNTKHNFHNRNNSPLIINFDNEDNIKNNNSFHHFGKIDLNDDDSSRYTDSFFTNTRKRTNCSVFTTTKKRTKLKKKVRFIDMIDNSQNLCEVIEIQAYKNSKFMNLKDLLISIDQNHNQCCCITY